VKSNAETLKEMSAENEPRIEADASANEEKQATVSNRHKSVDLTGKFKVETDEEKFKRFEELTRHLKFNSESSGDAGSDPSNKAARRKSFLPQQAFKVAEKLNISKRHTINLANAGIDDLVKAFDKDGKRVFKMGSLEKRSDILKKWKPKFFVAREDKFMWFKDVEAFQNGNKPEGSMVYKNALADKEDELEMGRPFVFSFNSRGKACFICAKDEAERTEWIQMLKKIIKEH
jgi:hypothetical protein